MNTVADSLFSALMSWVRALVNGIWAIFSSERTTILEFLGKNWLLIVAALIAFGLVVDWLIWLLRWQPYHLWAQRARRLLRIEEPEEDDGEARAHAATMPQRRESEPPAQAQQWLPLEKPVMDEEDARRAMRQAESVPDESLGAYPGMRYDDSRSAQAAPLTKRDTQRFAAVHSEGPGAAEVARRRAEIDAWQQQLEEEARARAAAEAERARLAREAEEERRRLAWEAAQAERLRQEQEAAAAAKRAQQEQYARELAEYERKRAQYERELAEYERQKAAYDAEMARIAERQAQAAGEEEQGAQRSGRAAQDGKGARPESGLKNRVVKMAQMIEPEQTEVSGIVSLPPRVDPREAYGPATKPQKSGRRRK